MTVDHSIAASDEEKTRIRPELDLLFDELGLDDDSAIDLPYVTRAFRTVRDQRSIDRRVATGDVLVTIDRHGRFGA
ncbi:hypothetical protein [Microbacterium sp.]|uniref:hypothetical protein n=1 Tax=Microbacterium sp. TaxID=51671 RepID=UPI0035B3C012